MRRIPSLSHGRRPSVTRLLALLAMVVAASGTSVSSAGDDFVRVVDRRVVMGTSATIQVYAPDEATGYAATRAAFARMAKVEDALSDYRPRSEAMRLVERVGESVEVSSDLATALRRSIHWHRLSGGGFDPTVGPLSLLWRTACREGEPPSKASVDFANDVVGLEKLEFDSKTGRVRCRTAGLRLDFGGIGKGMAADAGLAVLRAHGLVRALVEVGGDLVAGFPPPESPGWRVRIRTIDGDDDEIVMLENGAIATSGDVEQFLDVERNGGIVRLSHLLDPRTGRPIEARREVTVLVRGGVSPGADADALASCASVLGFNGSMRLADGTTDGWIRFHEIPSDGELGRTRRIPLAADPTWARVGPAAVLVEGFEFSEGPVFLSNGDLLVTDQPRDRIVRIDSTGGVSVMPLAARRANGLAVSGDGRLLGCAEADNQLVAWADDGTVEVLADRDSNPFNGPNDLWVGPSGRIWFTDPFYRRPWFAGGRKGLRADVHRLDPDGTCTVAATGFVRPNGIVGRPDGSRLYVADLDGGRTDSFAIDDTGALGDRRAFFPLGSDGMAMASDGAVVLTGKGVHVVSADGALIRTLVPDERWISNACFDPAGERLVVTAVDRVLVFELAPEVIEGP
ncbi:MAG: FAD:protein FMN transferase [Phycisphaerales bacterium]|nr:FAD:protein FMN transferase [Phycisphaerales bacterium]